MRATIPRSRRMQEKSLLIELETLLGAGARSRPAPPVEQESALRLPVSKLQATRLWRNAAGKIAIAGSLPLVHSRSGREISLSLPSFAVVAKRSYPHSARYGSAVPSSIRNANGSPGPLRAGQTGAICWKTLSLDL